MNIRESPGTRASRHVCMEAVQVMTLLCTYVCMCVCMYIRMYGSSSGDDVARHLLGHVAVHIASEFIDDAVIVEGAREVGLELLPLSKILKCQYPSTFTL